MRRVLGMGIVAVALVAAGPATPTAVAGGVACRQQTEGRTAEVEMKNFCFAPSVLHVEPGTTVRFVNRDPVEHVVVGTAWSVGDRFAAGDSAQHRFATPGAYPYTCYLHPGMNGVVLVGDTQPTAAAASSHASNNRVPPLATAAATAAIAGFVVGRAWRVRRARREVV